MSRRSAYLLAWGVAFAALGVFLVEEGGASVFWEFAFGVSGAVAIVGAVTRPRSLDVAGFVLLTVVAGARGALYITDYFRTGNGTLLFGATVWCAVAIAQFIVSGWPDSVVEVCLHTEQETNESE